MLYPVYVHTDEDTAYGLTFPDFEGCFSAADEMQDIQRMAQQGKARALEARSKQQPEALAGVPPPDVIQAIKAKKEICPPKTPKRPVVAGGIRPHKPIVNPPKK